MQWEERCNRISRINIWTALAAVATAMLPIFAAAPSQAQSYRVIHAFSGGVDGSAPYAGMTMDAHGNFYGTTSAGGVHGCGNVFKLSPHGSQWTLAPLYNFTGGADGCSPYTRANFGPDGSLYGTTFYCTVYNLRPPPTRPASVLESWDLTTIDNFSSLGSSCIPAGDLIFDSSGNLYGALLIGGSGCYNGCGLIYELAPSGGGWTQTVLHNFQGPDGDEPEGVVLDHSGNLLGTTALGGANDNGSIFELTHSFESWTETVLYSFDYHSTGGFDPAAGLIEDSAGNFYGSTTLTPNGSGVIFELSPQNGGWAYTVIYNLPAPYLGGPTAPLTMDAAGNLYGTINGQNPEGWGAVFKLSPGANGWIFTSLHNFTGGSDGGHPNSNVTIDANGNLFGTATTGGQGCELLGCGVVWEITP